ncbi:hypothetical protein [Sinorhizobium meliloti]|uniref:hypothetical protein n=1 Tax=Rhizobium meliloti TaxID=382 RepID=UPI0019113B7A|nr:hypothetical protein [Sinorhizobium meliloti]
MAFSPNAETVFADGPFGSPLQPAKSEIRSLLAQYEAAIDAYSSGAGSIAKSTRALLFADLAHAADVTAWVYADSTVAYNGIYRKSGASGTGSWSLILPLPFSFIIASDAGTGTPNAIQATTSLPVSSSALVWMNVFEANTASPVTVSFNGGSALTIKTNSGNDVAVGGLTAGMIVMGIVSGSTFRLVSDQASSAIVAAAEAAQAAAEDAADRAEAAAATALATVATYGGSSSSDSSAAIASMASALGFVRFGAGSTLVDADIAIDVPIEFQMGAYITAAATRTVTITEVIDSPKQHIFRGDGGFILANDSDSGENARQVHASWFGAFPGKSTDQAPAIQKAFDAVGNSRESVIKFDVGNYLISSGMTTTRAALVQGAGTRRTVFLVTSDGYSVFTTGHTACRFADIQFEHHSSVVTNRVSPWITLSHDFCEVERVYMQDSFNQIIVGPGGANAKLRDINMVWRAYPFTASSSGILVRAAGCNIDGVFSNYSANGGPAAIIAVGPGASGNVSAPVIDNVNYVCASIGVLVHGDSISVSRGRITNVNYRGSAGNAPQAIKFLTSGTGSVFGFTVEGVEIASTATAGITFEQNSSGAIKEIVVDGVYDSGTTGNGIEFIRTAGVLSDIVIGATVNVRLRATPVFFSGSNTGIRIDPRAMVGGDVAGVFFRGSVADDTAFSVTLGRQIFSGVAIITAGVVDMGVFGIRAASAPAVSANRITDANVVAVATSLAGTTGTDGNLTLGVQDSALYVENRTGSAQNISLTVMGA